MPIHVTGAIRTEPDSGCIGGGVQHDAERGDGSYKPATTTCLVERDGTPYIMTCSHVFEYDDCQEDISGREVWHPNKGDELIWNVSDFDKNQDWAITPTNYFSEIDGFNNSIVGEPYSIGGWTTQDGIDDLIASNETVYKYGKNTNKESGTVEDFLYYQRCGSASGEGFVISTMDRLKGDSGGPVYQYINFNGQTYISIINLHWGSAEYADGYNNNQWSMGCAAYIIHGTTSPEITFGGNPTC